MKIDIPRTPYTVKYQDLSGKSKTIRRVPPKKLHTLLPEDQVQIRQKKNDDWNKGEQVYIDAINPKQPNTLQLADDDNNKTFMSFYDVKTTDAKTPVLVEEAEKQKDMIDKSYLLWP